MDHSADMAMAGIDTGAAKTSESETAPAVQPPPIEPDAMDVDQTDSTLAAESTATVAGIPDGPAPDQPKASSPEQPPVIGADGATQSMPYTARSPSAQSVHSSGSSQSSPNTFLSAAMDGTVRIWDRRVPNPVARIGNRPGVPPWCMSACWSPDGNMIYAGRRNGTVEEFDVRKARRGWEPERVLKFPAGSGAVSAVKPMANGRHLVW
jgi:transcriptional activator SPT8